MAPSLRRRSAQPTTPAVDQFPVASEPSFDSTVEKGRPGTINFRGFLQSEDYNKDLQPPQSFAVYDRMLRSDPTVGATYKHLTTPLRQAEASIEPGSDDPEHLMQAAFAHYALFEWLDRPWDQVLVDMLRFLQNGVSVLEETYRDELVEWEYRMPGDPDPVQVPLQMKRVWDNFSTRLPRTIWKWGTDYSGRLAVIQQKVYDDRGNGPGFITIDIPASKCLVLVNDRIGNDFWGTSVLRGAYKPWWLLEAVQRVAAIGMERYLVPTPMVRMNSTASEQQRRQLAQDLSDLRSGEATSMAYSSKDGIDCENEGAATSGNSRAIWFLQPEHTPPDAIALIRHLEGNIFTNIMARFMDLGQRETGARATAEIQDDPFYLGLLTVARQITEEFNRGPLKRLIDENFPNVSKYPKLCLDKIAPMDIPIIAKAAEAYAAVGFLTPDFETEQWIRGQLSMPDKLLVRGDEATDELPDADERPEDDDQGTGSDDTGPDKTPQDYATSYPSVLGIQQETLDVQREAAQKAAETATQSAQIRAQRSPVHEPATQAGTSDAGGGTALAEALAPVRDRLLREVLEAVREKNVRAIHQLRAKDLRRVTEEVYQLAEGDTVQAQATAAALGTSLEIAARAEALRQLSEGAVDEGAISRAIHYAFDACVTYHVERMAKVPE